MAPADSATLVYRFYDELWNQADESVASEILHPALSFRGSLGSLKSGPAGFIEYLREVHATLADFRCVIDDLIATEEGAAARMTFSGIHRARFFGVPATGRQVTWSGAAFFAIADQRIKNIWVLGDIDSIRQQLGAPRDASFTEA